MLSLVCELEISKAEFCGLGSQSIQPPWLRPWERNISDPLVMPARGHHLLRWSGKGVYNDSSWQVNHSPSFTTDSGLDQEVKDALLCDAITLVNLRGCDKRKVMEEDKRRIKERLFQCYQQPRESRCARCLACV